ncbi:hypothetical protein [Mycolicibacterium pulveris]|uniref:hypothetical protein n=1 Tax=Mycolicibacterium pulveris TaxID=36813 RepID=UPI003CEE4013
MCFSLDAKRLMMVSPRVVHDHDGLPESEVDSASEKSASLRGIQLDVVRRYATIVAVLAAIAEVLLLVLGVDNWRVGLALAVPILLGIICGASKNRPVGQSSRPTHLHPLYTGIVGGTAMVGIGMHSLAGVLLAAVALLALAWFPLPPLQLLVVALAAMGPWVAETIAGAQGTGSLLLGLLVIAMVALIWARSKDIDALVLSLCVAAILYVAAAVVMFVLGVRADYSEGYLSESLTTYGPFTFRWRLPLSVSWVIVPTVATLGTVLSTWVLRIDRRRIGAGAGAIKVLCAGGLVIHIVAVVGANGRTHVVAALVGAVIASGVLPVAFRNGLTFLSWALWLAPLWWASLIRAGDSLFAAVVVNYLPARGSAARTATLQGRTLVWDISLDAFNRGTFPEQASGWGPDGHIASGAATQYSGVIGGVYRSGYYPPHNALIEVLLSGGLALSMLVLAGIAFILVMQASVLRHGSAPTAAGIAALSVTLAAVTFPEVATLPSNASPAAIAALVVTMVTLAAYSQTVLSRRRREDAESRPAQT